jgi:hypothetical protein
MFPLLRTYIHRNEKRRRRSDFGIFNEDSVVFSALGINYIA